MCRERGLGENPCMTEQHIQKTFIIRQYNDQLKNNHKLTYTHSNNTSDAMSVKTDKKDCMYCHSQK